MDIPSIINHNYYVIKARTTNRVWICEAERFDDKESKLYYYYGTYELGSDEHKNNHYLSNSYYDILSSENDEVRLATMEEIDILMDILEKNGIVTTLQEAKDKAKAPTLNGTDIGNMHAYTIPDGYEFVKIRKDAYNRDELILQKKRPSYPKTYGECCRILGFCSNTLKWDNPFHINRDTHPYIKHFDNLIESFYKLLIYRDAYWKIAGEEMGLGKPWEPDWYSIKQSKFGIHTVENQIKYITLYVLKNFILVFPTEEMRDAFYDNFKDLIEQCKELL